MSEEKVELNDVLACVDFCAFNPFEVYGKGEREINRELHDFFSELEKNIIKFDTTKDLNERQILLDETKDKINYLEAWTEKNHWDKLFGDLGPDFSFSKEEDKNFISELINLKIKLDEENGIKLDFFYQDCFNDLIENFKELKKEVDTLDEMFVLECVKFLTPYYARSISSELTLFAFFNDIFKDLLDVYRVKDDDFYDYQNNNIKKNVCYFKIMLVQELIEQKKVLIKNEDFFDLCLKTIEQGISKNKIKNSKVLEIFKSFCEKEMIKFELKNKTTKEEEKE